MLQAFTFRSVQTEEIQRTDKLFCDIYFVLLFFYINLEQSLENIKEKFEKQAIIFLFFVFCFYHWISHENCTVHDIKTWSGLFWISSELFPSNFNSVDKSLTWFMYSVYFTELTGQCVIMTRQNKTTGVTFT